MKDILTEMKERVMVFDGAMGTMLYSKGVFINACYEHLCLTNPGMIKEIHQEYLEAGADVVETNTYGANRIKLKSHGLAEQVEAINRAGVRIAREATGPGQYVAGSIGPCLQPGQLYTQHHEQELRDTFAEQLGFLVDEGVDMILFETFVHSEEMKLAASVAHGLGPAVFVSVTVGHEGETRGGLRFDQIIRELDRDPNVDGIGLNCGVGPAAALSIAEKTRSLTAKPFIAMPNAGYPQQVEGRMIYMTTPEYFTTYAMNLVRLGVNAIGGCCGTTPDHISEMATAIRAASGIKKYVQVMRRDTDDTVHVDVVPFEKKCAFAAKLARGEKVTSIEITPPRSVILDGILAKAAVCKEHGIDAINIPDGPRASARISPMITALKIEEKVGIETVLHYCCRDRNLLGMQSDLLGGYAAGLHNYLIITGDPPKLGDYPHATPVFDVDAIGLTQVVANLNHGMDIGGNRIEPPTAILIGVGANPCAIEWETEIKRYFNKIEAGAEYAITQPIFDADALLRFLDRIEEYPKRIPVIAGVWPLVSYRNAEFLRNEVPGVEVPDWIMQRMSEARTKDDGRRIGIEIAHKIRDQVADRVAGFQVSAPFGLVDLALQVLE